MTEVMTEDWTYYVYISLTLLPVWLAFRLIQWMGWELFLPDHVQDEPQSQTCSQFWLGMPFLRYQPEFSCLWLRSSILHQQLHILAGTVQLPLNYLWNSAPNGLRMIVCKKTTSISKIEKNIWEVTLEA